MTPPALSQAARGSNPMAGAAPRWSPSDLRRLDWRFLLPDPSIGDVACLAHPGSSLATALRVVCRTVIHLDPRVPAAARHPLVVVDRADLDALRAAARAVSPDGWLYAEFLRRPRDLQAWLLHPARCRRELRRLGFDRIVASWHRPDFENSVEITPLHERAAGSFAMSRAPVNAKRRLQLAGGRFLHRTGLLPLVVPCFSLLAHRVQPPR